MTMLVILAAQLADGAAQFKSTVNFDPGPTRTQIYNRVLGQTGLGRLNQGDYVITSFYAEPDEVAA